MTVINFCDRVKEQVGSDMATQEAEAYVTGEARCGACKFEWVSVNPAGVYDLECPDCGSMRGFHKNHIEPSEGMAYTCGTCSGDLFTLMDDYSAMCAGCGLSHYPYQVDEDVGA